jgi:Tol biopolymer transport system component
LLVATSFGLKEGIIIMKIKILSVLIFAFIVNSCKESSNPIVPINNVHSKILFLANNQLGIINADGSDFQLIPTEGNISFAANLSFDASKIVYGCVDNIPQQILLFNLHNNETTKITDDNLFHDSPILSPDCSSVLFLTRTDWMYHLYSKNIVNGEVKVLNNKLNSHDPIFSSDGSRIACWINNGGDSVGIVLMDNDGNNPELIGQGYYPEFSPNGKKILYQIPISSSNEGLYIMNLDGTENKFLSLIPFQTKPRFSPDGSRIVFTFFTTNFDIYLISIDGSNLVNITNDADGETQPVFTSDGSKIVFVQYDSVSSTNKLCSMNIDGTDRKTIFEDSSNYGIRIF